jgi:3-oxoacyl-[acyl-carrier-protein] synthase II
MPPEDTNMINTPGTRAIQGRTISCPIEPVFAEHSHAPINNTRGFIGHATDATSALELANNLPSFKDHILHPTINLEHLGPNCPLNNVVINEPKGIDKIDYIVNNSLGIRASIQCLLLRDLRNEGEGIFG